MAHHVYITKGIVFEKRDTGEAHATLSVFTKDLGMVDAYMQGVRRGKSKLRNHAEEYTVGTIGLVRGKTYWRVTTMASDRNMYFALSGNNDARQALARVFSLVRRLVSGEEKNENLFELLEESFSILIHYPHISRDKVALWECTVVSRVLHNLGYMTMGGVMQDVICLPWDPALFNLVGEHRTHIISRINTSLSASGL